MSVHEESSQVHSAPSLDQASTVPESEWHFADQHWTHWDQFCEVWTGTSLVFVWEMKDDLPTLVHVHVMHFGSLF